MPLDATAREANVLDSIKKFFIDNIYEISSIPVLFDIGLNSPNIRTGSSATKVEKWVSVNIGTFIPEHISDLNIRLYLCSRNDKEGFKLAQLRDTVLGYLKDSTADDGMRRIPLYRSHVDASKWQKVGGMLVYVDIISGNLLLEDVTKYKVIECTLRWGAKI